MAGGAVGDGPIGGHTDVGMRLTIVISSTQRRGAEVFASQLAEALPARGWVVDLVALADRPAGVEGVVGATPLSEKAPGRLGRLDASIVAALRRRVAVHSSQVVLANGSSTLQYGVAAVRTLPRRPLLVYASIGEPLYWAADARRRLTYRLMLGLTDHVVSVSGPTARQLTERLGVPSDKVSVLHTGVPAEFLSIPVESHDDGQLRILFAGSLSAEKNPLAALEVFRRVRAVVPARMCFAGAGALDAQLADAAVAAGVAEDVELAGSVRDMRPVFEWADVLLLTSRTEGLPGIALEAAAAGVPVVGFDVGGVVEAIVDGVTGVVVPADDVDAAAAALIRLGTDEDWWGAASAAGRESVRNHFTMAHAIERYDRALRTVIETRGSR